ncbi:MAG: hypothetical protein JY451_12665 [Erythrobacter sp.]|nr:MAG: hypothetical protein JY451_12665 [Erythrobacter sp.]
MKAMSGYINENIGGTNGLTDWNINGTKASQGAIRERPAAFVNLSRGFTASHKDQAMLLSVAISLFFGLVAALSLASCRMSLSQALRHYRSIRAELRELDRALATGGRPARLPLRQPREALALALTA